MTLGTVVTDRLLVPGDVQIAQIGDKPHVVWTHSKTARARGVDAPRDLLSRFVGLAKARDNDIVHFAGEYGILGICSHGVPRTHRMERLQRAEGMSLEDDGGDCEPLGFAVRPRTGEASGHEPIEEWRRWAQRAANVLALAAAAHHDTKVHKAASDGVAQDSYSQRQRRLRADVSKHVQSWLELGDVRPQFSWAKTGEVPIRLSFGTRSTWEAVPRHPGWEWMHAHGTTLFGTLALQLAMSVTQADGFAFCSGCGQSYPITLRRPAAGRRSYCPVCRADGVPLRDAQRDSRSRRRAQRRG